MFGKKKSNDIVILSPFKGKVVELKNVADEVFAGEMVGKGFAVTPDASETKAVSPTAKGKVKLAFETGHAYGIDAGEVELLIHIGIDTVTLGGEGFNIVSNSGAKIKEGSVLAEVDLKLISEKAPSIDTMVLVTNESIGDYKIERIAGDTVEAGEPLYKLVK